MVINFIWKIIRISLLVGGSFVIFYGAGQLIGDYGFKIGCVAGGLAAVIVSILMLKPPVP